jgi:2-C-methyl-D-erythritol 4-phosphate cytidylyltransferase
MRTTAILLAAGSGERLGRSTPKALVPMCGWPLFLYSLAAIKASQAVDNVIMVVPPGEIGRVSVALPTSDGAGPAIAEGGRSRQESVRLGLAAIDHESWPVDVVICHDAARPFASPNLFARVVDAVRRADGALPIVPSPDTVKRLHGEHVSETIPREEIGLAQTPQAFAANVLRQAHEQALADGREATDDAMLLEAAGFEVAVVQGEVANFKITTAEDLERAEWMAPRWLGRWGLDLAAAVSGESGAGRV